MILLYGISTQRIETNYHVKTGYTLFKSFIIFSDYLIVNKENLKTCIRQVTFSPDGKIMIAVGDNAKVMRFDLDESYQKL